jgi:hypothetical protein
VNTAQLQKLFGFLLIFPLVTMMRLGHLWLDPSGSDLILATIGNTIIWLLISLLSWMFSSYRDQRNKKGIQKNHESFSTPISE